MALVTAAIVVFVEESTSSGRGEEEAPTYNGSRVTDSLKLVITVSRLRRLCINLVKFVIIVRYTL